MVYGSGTADLGWKGRCRGAGIFVWEWLKISKYPFFLVTLVGGMRGAYGRKLKNIKMVYIGISLASITTKILPTNQ